MIRKRENPVVDVKGKGRMDSMLWFYKMATATQIAPHYSQCMLRTMYEVTTHQTLKQMGYSGKRPHSVPLLLATVHRHTMSFIFCWDIQMAGSEFGVNGVKNAIVPFFSSVMVLRIFSCHTLGFIRNNLGMIIYHRLPEYYCWSCPLWPSCDGCIQHDNSQSQKAQNCVMLIMSIWTKGSEESFQQCFESLTWIFKVLQAKGSPTYYQHSIPATVVSEYILLVGFALV